MKSKSSTAPRLPEEGASASASATEAPRRASRRTIGALPIVEALSAVFCAGYAYIFYQRIAPYWFNPKWTTDDALQQAYPFYKALNPELFQGDLITKMMECYLAPLHYLVSYAVVLLTKDPIMMGHWVMLLQIAGSVGFMFLAVRAAAGTAPAFFAVAWLLHTRHIMQRITCGLPRGWSAPLLCAYLYCAISGRLNGVLLVILVGCLLHPPSTLIIALAHGMYLLWRVARKDSRAEYFSHLIRYLLCAPVFALLTFSVVKMPPEIGNMADYATASQMPEFITPGGRFPFTPFKPAWTEIRSFGFQAFMGRLHNPGPFWKAWLPTVVMISLAAILAVGFKRKRETVPWPALFFLGGSIIVYFASRILAFRLYVPDRHIQFPFGIFFIAAFSIGAWRAFEVVKPPLHRLLTGANLRSRLALFARRQQLASVGALVLVGTLVWIGSGHGLQGSMNFNWEVHRRGGAFSWIKKNTAPEAVIAGDPTFIDPIQLFSARVGYVTTETSHPFYDRYYAEMKRRLHIALAAEFAETPKDLVTILQPEGVDLFVFDPSKFTQDALQNSKYFEPFNAEVRAMTTRPSQKFAYREIAELPKESGVVVFRDRHSMVVDLKRLGENLRTNGQM